MSEPKTAPQGQPSRPPASARGKRAPRLLYPPPRKKTPPPPPPEIRGPAAVIERKCETRSRKRAREKHLQQMAQQCLFPPVPPPRRAVEQHPLLGPASVKQHSPPKAVAAPLDADPPPSESRCSTRRSFCSRSPSISPSRSSSRRSFQSDTDASSVFPSPRHNRKRCEATSMSPRGRRSVSSLSMPRADAVSLHDSKAASHPTSSSYPQKSGGAPKAPAPLKPSHATWVPEVPRPRYSKSDVARTWKRFITSEDEERWRKEVVNKQEHSDYLNLLREQIGRLEDLKQKIEYERKEEAEQQQGALDRESWEADGLKESNSFSQEMQIEDRPLKAVKPTSPETMSWATLLDEDRDPKRHSIAHMDMDATGTERRDVDDERRDEGDETRDEGDERRDEGEEPPSERRDVDDDEPPAVDEAKEDVEEAGGNRMGEEGRQDNEQAVEVRKSDGEEVKESQVVNEVGGEEVKESEVVDEVGGEEVKENEIVDENKVNENEVLDGEEVKENEVVDEVDIGEEKKENMDGEEVKESEVVDGEEVKESEVVDGEEVKENEVVDEVNVGEKENLDGAEVKENEIKDGEEIKENEVGDDYERKGEKDDAEEAKQNENGNGEEKKANDSMAGESEAVLANGMQGKENQCMDGVPLEESGIAIPNEGRALVEPVDENNISGEAMSPLNGTQNDLAQDQDQTLVPPFSDLPPNGLDLLQKSMPQSTWIASARDAYREEGKGMAKGTDPQVTDSTEFRYTKSDSAPGMDVDSMKFKRTKSVPGMNVACLPIANLVKQLDEDVKLVQGLYPRLVAVHDMLQPTDEYEIFSWISMMAAAREMSQVNTPTPKDPIQIKFP